MVHLTHKKTISEDGYRWWDKGLCHKVEPYSLQEHHLEEKVLLYHSHDIVMSSFVINDQDRLILRDYKECLARHFLYNEEKILNAIVNINDDYLHFEDCNSYFRNIYFLF